MESQEFIPSVKDLQGLYNATNIVNKTEYQQYLLETLDIIIDHLKDICGPMSNTAMFIYKDSSGKTNHIFSKDGINMLNSMEFYNPIQQDIIYTISQIGHFIDTTSGDGSTTSMLFAALLLKELYDPKYDHIFTKYPLEEIKYFYKDRLQYLQKLLNESYKLTVKDLSPNQKRTLIYKQVLHSSHNNTEFAHVITELLDYIPDVKLDSISYTESNRSDSLPLSIYHPKADYITTVHHHTQFTNNINFNTELMYDNVQLVFAPRLGWDEITILKEQFSNPKYFSLEHPVIIFTPRPEPMAIKNLYEDDTVISHISVFSFTGMDAPNREVPFQESIILSICNEFKIYQDPILTFYITHCDQIEFKYGKQMNFYGLIPKTTSSYHPYYHEKNNEHEYYQTFITKITDRINELKNSPIPMKQELTWLEEVLDDLIIVRKPKLVLGGDINQRNNNKDAFHDAVKSLLPILTEGYYLNIWELLLVVLIKEENNIICDMENELSKHIYMSIYQTIHKLYYDYVLPGILNRQEDSEILGLANHRLTYTQDDINKILQYYLEFEPILPINASLMVETLFTKIVPIIMMRFLSYAIYQGSINLDKPSSKD
jgi:hypothetical protein